MKELFEKINAFFDTIPEHYLDVVLIGVILVLAAIVLWGEKHHKAWACLYFLL